MKRNPSKRNATCSCRKLKITTLGEPVRVAICHCYECQLRTGSAFGVQARFPTKDVEVVGDFKTHTRIAEDGEPIHFHFCPSCGSTVFYELETTPELTAIPVGAFADAQFPSPAFSVFESRKHSWVAVPKGVDRLD